MPNPRRMARRTARRTSKRTAKRVAAQQQAAAAPAVEEEMDPLELIAEILGVEAGDDVSDEQLKAMLKDAIDKL